MARKFDYWFVMDDGRDVLVTYQRAPFDPGRISGPPELCYPPEGGEVEDWDAGGVLLTRAETERLEEELDALPMEEPE